MKDRGERWERSRRAAFERGGYTCRRCGAGGPLEAHHVTPIGAGGAVFDLANIESLCRTCHIAVHRRAARRGRRPDFRMPAGWWALVNEARARYS